MKSITNDIVGVHGKKIVAGNKKVKYEDSLMNALKNATNTQWIRYLYNNKDMVSDNDSYYDLIDRIYEQYTNS